MTRLLFPFLACLLCAGLAFFTGCVGGSETGNPTYSGGTETGNPTAAKVRGKVVDSTGTPRCSVRVSLLPVAYNPIAGAIAPDSMTALTDSAGEYEIPITLTNDYRLTGIHPVTGTRVYRSSVLVLDSGIVSIGADTLAAPGIIRATLSPANLTAGGYLYVPGTRIFSRVLQPGATDLDSVPAGRMSVLFYDTLTHLVKSPGNEYNIVQVVSGDTTIIRDNPPIIGGGVSVSGNNQSIHYAEFQFVPINFLGTPFITLLSYNGPDTLAMVFYKMVTPNTAVDFSDTLFLLAGSIGAMQSAFYSMVGDSIQDPGYISGSVFFTAFDTSSLIEGTFPAGSSLLGINMANKSLFPCSIAGDFRATRVR